MLLKSSQLVSERPTRKNRSTCSIKTAYATEDANIAHSTASNGSLKPAIHSSCRCGLAIEQPWDVPDLRMRHPERQLMPEADVKRSSYRYGRTTKTGP